MFNGERAAEIIKMSGRTRKWVAAQCRIEHQTLNSYLRGIYNPSEAVVALMAMALGVPEEELWAKKSSPKPAA